MRLQDLAARLVAVEAKLATLTGTSVNTENATSIEELDARLSVVEAHVDHLITVQTQAHVDAIISAPAGNAPVDVEEVVALSPSVDHSVAADIVAEVVTAQFDADPVHHSEVADIISAAVMAVVKAEPDVVVDAVAITEAIVQAVADMPAPTAEAAEQAAEAVANIVAAATGEEIHSEVHQQIHDAVSAPADPALDEIEHRLDAVEAKVDSLLGK